MMKIGRYMLSAAFLLLLAAVGLKSDPFKHAYQLCQAAMPSVFRPDGDVQAESGEDADTVLTAKDAATSFNDDLYQKDSWINLNGAMAKKLKMKGLYKDLGIYVLDNGYIVSNGTQTSTDYEYEEIMGLKSFLDERGVQLLYVNAPTKYLDDHIFMDEFGLACYSNQNADRFLKRIADAGITNIDLRSELLKDGKNIYDMFYRTDHHWTVDSGLWAAGKLAEVLNAEFGYHIDTSMFDMENYDVTLYEKCWLGEQGRKVAQSYVGLDDFMKIEPRFDTSLTMRTAAGAKVSGDFSIFMDKDACRFSKSVYDEPSMHYSYIRGGINRTRITNQKVSDGKVLLLADSYSQVALPFLSLGVSQVDTLALRAYDGSLREYIDAGDYDTVVILYAQFMIGAHDYESSANYNMFRFE